VLLIGVILLGAFSVVVHSTWPDEDGMHEHIEWIGIFLIVICILGRTWCSYYISGRKDVTLVTVGPYSVCRNPLYVFSIVGAFGVGAQFGSLVATVVFGAVTWILFDLVAAQEEKSLLNAYGQIYDDYRAGVPRFLPRLSRWRGAKVVDVHYDRVVRTFIDASVFLLAIPITETLEYFQDAGLWPVLFRIP
jgi:protein-S-isoprenylcysteine O-methyltransferase Ste14